MTKSSLPLETPGELPFLRGQAHAEGAKLRAGLNVVIARLLALQGLVAL